jgi:DNA primase
VRAVARAPMEFRRGPRNRLPEPKLSLSARGGQLATSSLVRGHLAAVPAREALILLAVLSHPWLLSEHAEEFVELEFVHRDAEALRKAILAAAASGHAQDADALKARLEESGNAELRTRMERAISHKSNWPIDPKAAREDVLAWWHQIARLHHNKTTLSKALKEADRAYMADMSDANFARLKDIQEQLANLDGTEAMLEGFGEPSGRPARTM